MGLLRYWSDFLFILFPKTCGACENVLIHQEEYICTTCLYHLPFTDFHQFPINPSAKKFWGKLEFEQAVSMFYLTKSSLVETLIHNIKYNNRPELAYFLGQKYGSILRNSNFSNGIDLIIPIPLHTKKLKIRGYNQSLHFARGLSESMEIPCNDSLLKRTIHTVSQTKKDRLGRFENVELIFECNLLSKITAKHILIVDDVLTTGATLCSAASCLIEAMACKVSFATIAKA